jgi:hypothetical protein
MEQINRAGLAVSSAGTVEPSATRAGGGVGRSCPMVALHGLVDEIAQ